MRVSEIQFYLRNTNILYIKKSPTYTIYQMDRIRIIWGKIIPAKRVIINMLETQQKVKK